MELIICQDCGEEVSKCSCGRWKITKVEDVLPLVDSQIGGAARALGGDRPYYKACTKCQEDGSGDFSCFFRHATDEQKRRVLKFAAEEGWKEQDKMVQGAKLFARDFTETIEDLAKDDAPTPENDSWKHELMELWYDQEKKGFARRPEFNEVLAFIASHKDTWEREAYELGDSQGYFRGMKEALAGDIKRYPLERDAVVRQEERTKLREVVESLNEQNQITQAILGALEYRGFSDLGKYLDGDLWERIKPIILTALSEGEGR